MHSILADIVWPALYLESRLLAIWVIVAGLFVEYFFVWGMTDLGPLRSVWANLAMNAASALLGILFIPVGGLIVALVPGEFFGTFSPVTWSLTFVMAVLLNTWIESVVLWKVFKQDIGKKQLCWLGLANAISVGIAFASFLVYPLKD